MNTLKKMFLLTTIVFLLIGFASVSAEDVETADVADDVTSANDYETTGVANEQNTEESPMLGSSPEADIQTGSTTTTADDTIALSGEHVDLSATVDRIIPGSRLSEGNVKFDVNDGEIVTEVPLLDGEATTKVLIPDEWVGQNITYTASFLGSQSFSPSSGEAIITVVREFYDTVTTIDPVIGEFNKPITITANVQPSVQGELTGGSVFFTTETGNITDEDGYTIYVDVTDSVAKLETIALPSWKDDGDISTIWATYTGFAEFQPSESEATALRIYDKIYNTTTTMAAPKGQYDEPINFTATVISEDGTPIEGGAVHFVIGNKNLTDEDGSVLYAYPENGIATLETVASRNWEDEGDVFTAYAIFDGVGEYLGSESEDVGVALVEEYFDTTTTINPVIGEFNKPITITANVVSSVEGNFDEGEVYFTTEAGVIKDENGNILYAPLVDGVATLETTAQESWVADGDVCTIWATYNGSNEFLPSESEATALRLYDKIYNTTTLLVPPYGIYDYPMEFKAYVMDENGNFVDCGQVYFVINGIKNVTDENGNVAYADVNDGIAYVITTAQRSWQDGGDIFTVKAVYLGVGEYLDSESEYEALTIKEPIYPQYTPEKHAVAKKTSKTLKDTSSVKTYKVLVKDNVVTTGKVITLKNLNDIFNKDFRNGMLVVYLDGKVVFNSTTTDDLSTVILNIVESLIGEHELKVEFTGRNNETNTYAENITIQ